MLLGFAALVLVVELLYLPLGEVQVDGDFVAAEACQVVVVGELGLQLPQLLLGERCALFAGLAAGVNLETGLLEVCGGAQAQSWLIPLSRVKPPPTSYLPPPASHLQPTRMLTWASSTQWLERVRSFQEGFYFTPSFESPVGH